MVSCGTGIVASTIAGTRVAEMLDANGYAGQYEIAQVPLDEAAERSGDFDFAVAATIAPGELRCPYVNGVPYLMGTGTEASDREILRLMEEDGE